MVVLTEAPPCDMDEAHVATIHCPSCDEYFCAGCDALVHARKKCKDHIRDAIEIVEPTVPCDSNPEHVAVMYCEDCEENFCGDCDYAFHSRKKTANHARFEGARRPEDIEALKKEAEAEALAQQLAQQRIAQQQQQQQSKAGASYAAAAATGAKGGVNTSASPPKPATGAAGKTLTSASAAATKPSSAAAAAPAAAASAAVSSTPSFPADDGEEEHKSAEERAAEYKAQWDARRKALCKEKYNVGHWLGLTTDERKDLSVQLCRELLFNPEPSNVKGNRMAVEWSVQSFWTTYGVAVTCRAVAGSARKGKQTVTTYKVMVDDMGRLDAFDVDIDGVAQTGACVVM